MFNQIRENEYERHAFAILKELGLMPCRDGSAWCVLWGDNIQEGVFAAGDSVRQKVMFNDKYGLTKWKDHEFKKYLYEKLREYAGGELVK